MTQKENIKDIVLKKTQIKHFKNWQKKRSPIKKIRITLFTVFGHVDQRKVMHE